MITKKESNNTTKAVILNPNAKIEAQIDLFCVHMVRGMENLQEACAIYAKSVSEDYTAAFKFAERFPHITKTTWDKFRLVGVGAVDPVLLMVSDRLGSKMAKLPIKTQKEIVSKKIKVLKNTKVVEKDIRDLTVDEERSVFTNSMVVRSIDEQRKRQESKNQKSLMTKAVPFKVSGDVLQVVRSCTISKIELIKILKDMG